MGNRDSALRRYYRTVYVYLPCSRKLKKKILYEIKGNITAYLEENPDADYSQIESHFGTPRSIAAAYVDDMNTEELIHALHIRKKIVTCIVSILLTSVLLWAIGLTYIMVDHSVNYPGTVCVEVGELESSCDGMITTSPEPGE